MLYYLRLTWTDTARTSGDAPARHLPAVPSERVEGRELSVEHLSNSEQETERLGEKLGERLTRGSVVAYTGELGMGKTAFTRGLARALGCEGRISSPTFTIVNEYEGDIPLFHFDLYRLGSSDELFDIGWEDYLARGGVCAVEWSERADDAFDDRTVRVDFRRDGVCDGRRVITITGVDGL